MSDLKNSSEFKSKNRIKLVLSFIMSIIFVFLMFWLLSGICFGILNILIKAQKLKVSFVCDWQQYLFNPKYVFVLYGDWWGILIKSMRHITFNKVLFIPFIALIGTLIAAFIIVSRQEYAVRLWYILNFHFAKIKDIKKMALFKNAGMVLGRFSGKLLSAKSGDSVLCIGEMGSGKTSSVSIPSVLSADNASVLAVDLTGILPQHTAGYRSKIGEIAYFNWDVLDDVGNNVFYPRWNPFVSPHLPEWQDERDEYVKRLASYFVDTENDVHDNYWNMVVHGLLATIFSYWIAKIGQAKANDYFLEKMATGDGLTKDDKDVLLSYYIQMPKSLSEDVISLLNDDMLTSDNYLPIGSWGGVPEPWLGKDLCFPMITDWLIYNYENSADNNSEDWYHWFKSLLNEAWAFAYGANVVDGFNRILHLSSKQRSLVFAQVIKPFIIFTDKAIRERTDGNDVDFAKIRGVYDDMEDKLKPMTIYSMANTAHSKIINQIFIDEILYYIMHDEDAQDGLPLQLVLDDIGHNTRLHNLADVLENGKKRRVSTLLLCNSLSLVANTYSREELEMMIMHTDYKIIKAADNRHLSQQMDKLASFSTRSVEIPQRKHNRHHKPYADANYFHRLAKDFKLCNDVKINTKEYQVVLVRGFYNRPIIADNIFFAQDEKFGKQAEIPSNFALPLQRVLQKQEYELNTPSVDYLTSRNVSKPEVYEEEEQQPKNEKKRDWWLDEDVFQNKKSNDNPFKNKQ